MSDTSPCSDVQTRPSTFVKHLTLMALPLSLLVTTHVFGHGAASAPATEGDPAALIQAEARKIIFPDTARHKTLVVDLHTHTVFSDGHVWPKIRVGEALRDGLDAMAVTEHLEYQPHIADIPHPDRNRAYTETVAAAEGSDLMVIAGSEITRGDPAGHINAIFINDANALFKVTTPPADPTDVRAFYEATDAWPAQNAVDAAAEQGIDLPYSCKGGVCATCRTHVRDGEVTMATNYGLEPWEVEKGFVLACQSVPVSDKVTIDYDKT